MAGTVTPKKKGKGKAAGVFTFLQEHKTETLIVLLGVFAIAMIAYKWIDYLTTSFTVRDAASEFADVLREARAVSSERRITVTVIADSATTWRNCTAKLLQGNIELTSLELPKGVSTDGTVAFGPYGIPLSAKNFVIRKGDCKLTVVVNEKGLVTVPSQ